MSRKYNPTPRFATETEERTFREQQDSTDHVDWSWAEHVRMPSNAFAPVADERTTFLRLRRLGMARHGLPHVPVGRCRRRCSLPLRQLPGRAKNGRGRQRDCTPSRKRTGTGPPAAAA